jgi:hypothetical protein
MPKDIPLDVDEENEERAKYAGLLQDEILVAASAIRTQKEKSSEIAGTLSGKLGVFEKKGGHKSALKTATMVCDKEPAELQDWMRSFLAYVDALGGNDQMDMIDQLTEQDKNAASVDVATKEATFAAKVTAPKTANEPAVH